MTRGRIVTIGAGLLGVAWLLAGCATVEPWQRAQLANPCMVFDSNGTQVGYDQHWQTAREGSAGGYGIQAGGCGCK